MKLQQSIESKWVKYISYISISIAKTLNIWKTEVVIKMYFAKQLFLLFFVNQEKLLVVSGKSLKNFSEQVHFLNS